MKWHRLLVASALVLPPVSMLVGPSSPYAVPPGIFFAGFVFATVAIGYASWREAMRLHRTVTLTNSN